MRPAVDMGTLHPKLIVGIGGSAGALNAYKAFLEAMPKLTTCRSALRLQAVLILLCRSTKSRIN